MENYRPLPDTLTISLSPIHGHGIVTTKPIPDNTCLGLSHIRSPELIRTPLGGYINHSDTPNCVVISEGNRDYIYTTENIPKNTEITLTYRTYRP